MDQRLWPHQPTTLPKSVAPCAGHTLHPRPPSISILPFPGFLGLLTVHPLLSWASLLIPLLSPAPIPRFSPLPHLCSPQEERASTGVDFPNLPLHTGGEFSLPNSPPHPSQGRVCVLLPRQERGTSWAPPCGTTLALFLRGENKPRALLPPHRHLPVSCSRLKAVSSRRGLDHPPNLYCLSMAASPHPVHSAKIYLALLCARYCFKCLEHTSKGNRSPFMQG